MREQVTKFHDQHPEVWDLFVKYTFELIKRGFKHYSAQHGIFARIRWETDKPNVDGKSTFKINNNYSAFYARRFMKMYPKYNGFFRTRQQTSMSEYATGMKELGPQDYPYETRH
jgi:hypothetical protein